MAYEAQGDVNAGYTTIFLSLLSAKNFRYLSFVIFGELCSGGAREGTRLTEPC